MQYVKTIHRIKIHICPDSIPVTLIRKVRLHKQKGARPGPDLSGVVDPGLSQNGRRIYIILDIVTKCPKAGTVESDRRLIS
jgi:hypothetical protein